MTDQLTQRQACDLLGLLSAALGCSASQRPLVLLPDIQNNMEKCCNALAPRHCQRCHAADLGTFGVGQSVMLHVAED